MGYYTDFEITMSKKIENFEEILEEITMYSFYEDNDGSYRDNCKWYNYETDMKTISKRYPEVIFEVNCNGEESGDIWRSYFKNGKTQTIRPRIVFPEFDENKLE